MIDRDWLTAVAISIRANGDFLQRAASAAALKVNPLLPELRFSISLPEKPANRFSRLAGNQNRAAAKRFANDLRRRREPIEGK